MQHPIPPPPRPDPSADALDFVGLALACGAAAGATSAGFVEVSSASGPDGPSVLALVDEREVGRGRPREVSAALASALAR